VPEVPPVVRTKALGAGAGRWLDGLPELIAGIERDWAISVGQVYRDATGCVALLRHDVGRGALLLERLGSSLYEQGIPLAQRQEILCATAQLVWRPASDAGLPTGEGRLGNWPSGS
jgi:streptomycin 6-kinase